MSASSFCIPDIWSVDKGDVWHVRCCSAISQRSLPADLDIFVAIFHSMPLLVYFMSSWIHVCVWGVPPLLPLQSTPTIMLPYPSLKLIVCLLSFSVLSVKILSLGSMLIYIKCFPGPLYLPSTLLRILPLMCLWMTFILGPLSSVRCTWLVMRLPLVVVAALPTPIVSLLWSLLGSPMPVSLQVLHLLKWIAPSPLGWQ